MPAEVPWVVFLFIRDVSRLPSDLGAAMLRRPATHACRDHDWPSFHICVGFAW